MKTTDFNRIGLAAPLDAKAATVRDGVGEHWEPKGLDPTNTQHWKAPPPPEGRLPPGAPDLTGVKIGRLTVVRFHALVGVRSWSGRDRRKWLVRCVCGDYETRSCKKIRENAASGFDACCQHCDALRRLQERTSRPPSKKDRKKSAQLLERLASAQRSRP